MNNVNVWVCENRWDLWIKLIMNYVSFVVLFNNWKIFFIYVLVLVFFLYEDYEDVLCNCV